MECGLRFFLMLLDATAYTGVLAVATTVNMSESLMACAGVHIPVLNK